VLGVYDGSGQPIAQSAIGNRFLWQGKEYSWKTGLYYNRARWYDPVTGRFISKDPAGITFGLNEYTYCGNNPVNFRDSSGLCEDDGYWSNFGNILARDWAWNASDGARGLLMSPWNLLKGMYGGVQGIGSYGGYLWEDPSGTWDATVNSVRNMPTTVPLALNQWATDPYAVGSTTGEIGLGWGVGKIYSEGLEFTFGKNLRIAPLGNRTGNPLGEPLHYHRRGVAPSGETIPGQGIGRHRPWETKSTDKSFWDRF